MKHRTDIGPPGRVHCDLQDAIYCTLYRSSITGSQYAARTLHTSGEIMLMVTMLSMSVLPIWVGNPASLYQCCLSMYIWTRFLSVSFSI